MLNLFLTVADKVDESPSKGIGKHIFLKYLWAVLSKSSFVDIIVYLLIKSVPVMSSFCTRPWDIMVCMCMGLSSYYLGFQFILLLEW